MSMSPSQSFGNGPRTFLFECAGYLLSTWRQRNQNAIAAEAMDEFLRQRCPKWAMNLTP